MDLECPGILDSIFWCPGEMAGRVGSAGTVAMHGTASVEASGKWDFYIVAHGSKSEEAV